MMKLIAKTENLLLYETGNGKGVVINFDTGKKSEEKAIISLLSMSNDWEAVEKEEE